MSAVEYYDSDDALNRSPPLSPVRPNYKPEESPVPLVAAESSSSSSAATPPDSGTVVAATGPHGQTARDRRRRSRRAKRKRQTQPSLSDEVLMRTLAPNDPDVATRAGIEALESASQSDDEDADDECMSDVQLEKRTSRPVAPPAQDRGRETPRSPYSSHDAVRAAKLASQALSVGIQDRAAETRDAWEPVPVRPAAGPPVRTTNGVHKSERGPPFTTVEPDPKAAHPKTLDLKPPPLKILAPLSTAESSGSSPGRLPPTVDLIARSPIARYTITSAEGNPESLLPAMQMSPLRSSTGHVPERIPTLPSLQTALSMNSPSPPYSIASTSPTVTRQSPAQFSHFAPSPSPYNHPAPGMSPPGIPTSGIPTPGIPSLPSHPSYWRTAPRENSISTPSDYNYSTPSSVTTAASSGISYATPTASIAESLHKRQDSMDMSIAAATPAPPADLSHPQPTPNGTSPQPSVNGTLPANTFKCAFPDCNAPPFQTQYLLNSHTNVHSSSRPHFCPVPDCSRGQGGRGFKRKNEMIRHGLVHDSPGYMCPFCPDQRHKYPRPDNLQRHVRVHHVDKDRDDPQLREVLAQRPEGGARGRRRRGGSG